MMKRWNVSDFATLAEGVLIGRDGPMPIRILSDSRDVMPGDAFIALSGTQNDGHAFLEDAVKRGAKILIGSNANLLLKHEQECACVIIKDLDSKLINIARAYTNTIDPIIISVTGSVGKTTTRECIYHVLSKKYKVHRPFRSYNTCIGCALTVLSMPADTNVLVLEMGANHENEIAPMVSFFPPDVAVITEAAAAHLEGFKNNDAIISTKCEIFNEERTKVLFYNSDRKELRNKIVNMAKDIKAFGIGFESASYKIYTYDFNINNGHPLLSFKIKTNQEEYHVKSKFVGMHNIYSLAFALAIGEYYKVTKQEILESIYNIDPIEGRGVYMSLKCGAVIIDESYNANPLSMNAALNALKKIANKSNKIVLLGEMKELGPDSVLYHRELLENALFCNAIILYGDIWNYVIKNVKSFNSNIELILCKDLDQCYDNISKYIKMNSVILIKGSHSNNLEFLVSKIKKEYGSCS